MADSRYDDAPVRAYQVPFFESTDLWLPNRGMGNLSPSGQQGSAEMTAKKAETLSKLGALLQALQGSQAQYNDGLSQIQGLGVPTATAQAQGVGAAITKAIQWTQGTQAAVNALTVPPAQPSSYPISDAAWHKMNDEIQPQADQTAQGVQSALATLPGIFNAARNASGQAASAAQTSQQSADASTYNKAKLAAASAAGQGNYAAALATLQAQAVIDAASRLGASDDLSTTVQTITYQQQQALKQQGVADKSQATCITKGGSWDGSNCDMSAYYAAQAQAKSDAAAKATADAASALGARVDAALAQAQGFEAQGNFRGAMVVLSGALGAASQIGRTSDVQLEMANAQQAAQDAQSLQAKTDASANVDSAIGQANAQAAAGNYAQALAILSGASQDAQVAKRTGDLNSAAIGIQSAQKASTVATPPQAPVYPVDVPDQSQGAAPYPGAYGPTSSYGGVPGGVPGYGPAPNYGPSSGVPGAGTNYGIDPSIYGGAPADPFAAQAGSSGMQDMLSQILAAIRGGQQGAGAPMSSGVPGGIETRRAPSVVQGGGGYESPGGYTGQEIF
jgi:hypothetical protein